MKMWIGITFCCLLFAQTGAQAETVVAENYFFYDEPTAKKSDDFAPVWMNYGKGAKLYVLAFERQVKTTGARELWALVADPVNPGKEFAGKITGARGGVSLGALRSGGRSKQFFSGYLSWAPEGAGRMVFIEKNTIKLGQLDLNVGTVQSKAWIDLEGKNNFRTDWSVDGKIVFVSELSGQGDLYVARAPSELPVSSIGRSSLKQLTKSDFLDTDPAWSPDGKQLVYTAEPQGHKDIFLLDNVDKLMTTGPVETGKLLVRMASVDTNPAWSADGGQIAFYALEMEEKESDDLFSEGGGEKKLAETAALYVVNADGSGLKKLADNVIRREDRGPAWMTQAKLKRKIVYVGLTTEGTALYVVDAETGTQQRVKVDNRLMSDVATMPFGEYPLIALSAHDREGRKRIYIKVLHFMR